MNNAQFGIQDFDIRNPSERKIVCTSIEKNTWSFDDKADRFLKVGETYTVVGVEVHKWHTRLTLAEFPNRQFHSVRFREVA